MDDLNTNDTKADLNFILTVLNTNTVFGFSIIFSVLDRKHRLFLEFVTTWQTMTDNGNRSLERNEKVERVEGVKSEI